MLNHTRRFDLDLFLFILILFCNVEKVGMLNVDYNLILFLDCVMKVIFSFIL